MDIRVDPCTQFIRLELINGNDMYVKKAKHKKPQKGITR
jgi:hypothetical protein